MTTTCDACGHENRPGMAFCPGCGKTTAGASIPAEPPPAQKTTAQTGGKPLWFILLTVCVSVIFLYLFFVYLPGGEHPVIAEQPAVAGDPAARTHVDQLPVTAKVDGANLSIALSEVLSKRIVAFEYSDGTVTVPLLAFITGEGKLVTSYRMCEPCNSKTYAIDGDRLSCGNCETQWSLNTLEGLQGNCQKFPPAPFPSVIDGDRVVMSIALIKEWKIRL